MHCVYYAQCTGNAGLGKHADSRRMQQRCTAFDYAGRYSGVRQLPRAIPCQDRGSLYRQPLGHDDAVALLCAPGGDQAARLNLAEHGTHEDGTLDTLGHLAVAADQG